MSDGLTARARRYGSSDGVGTAVDMASWRGVSSLQRSQYWHAGESRKAVANVTYSVTIEGAQIKKITVPR